MYNALQRNRIEPKIKKILRKKQNGFQRNRSTISQILTIRRISDVRAKNLEATLLFIDFLKAYTEGKRSKYFSPTVSPKKPSQLKMMLYKNMKVKVCSPDRDTDYCNIVAGVMQGDTLTPYLFIICLDYVLRTSIYLMKENGFTLAKEKKQKIPCTNYYGRGLHRRHSAYSKYTRPGRIPAT